MGAAIWKNKAIPESISAMVYDLPKKWRFLWILWMWAIAFLTIIPAIEILSQKGMEYIGFITLAGLVFTGAMPLVKNEKNTMHYVFAMPSGIVSQACVLFIYGDWLSLWLIIPIMMIHLFLFPDSRISIMFDGKGVCVMEILCYICIIFSLLTKIYANV